MFLAGVKGCVATGGRVFWRNFYMWIVDVKNDVDVLNSSSGGFEGLIIWSVDWFVLSICCQEDHIEISMIFSSDCTDFKKPTHGGFCAMFTPKLPIEEMLALNIIYRFQIGVRQVAWECQWKSKFKIKAYLTHVYIRMYVHTYIASLVGRQNSTYSQTGRVVFGVCYTQKKRCTLWCQGRRVFAWKVPSSFRQVGGAFFFAKWTERVGSMCVWSGCCATISLRKQDAGWMIRKMIRDDGNADFFRICLLLFVGMFGRYFFEGWGQCSYLNSVEVPTTCSLHIATHRWDYWFYWYIPIQYTFWNFHGSRGWNWRLEEELFLF